MGDRAAVDGGFRRCLAENAAAVIPGSVIGDRAVIQLLIAHQEIYTSSAACCLIVGDDAVRDHQRRSLAVSGGIDAAAGIVVHLAVADLQVFYRMENRPVPLVVVNLNVRQLHLSKPVHAQGMIRSFNDIVVEAAVFDLGGMNTHSLLGVNIAEAETTVGMGVKVESVERPFVLIAELTVDQGDIRALKGEAAAFGELDVLRIQGGTGHIKVTVGEHRILKLGYAAIGLRDVQSGRRHRTVFKNHIPGSVVLLQIQIVDDAVIELLGESFQGPLSARAAVVAEDSGIVQSAVVVGQGAGHLVVIVYAATLDGAVVEGQAPDGIAVHVVDRTLKSTV